MKSSIWNRGKSCFFIVKKPQARVFWWFLGDCLFCLWYISFLSLTSRKYLSDAQYGTFHVIVASLWRRCSIVSGDCWFLNQANVTFQGIICETLIIWLQEDFLLMSLKVRFTCWFYSWEIVNWNTWPSRIRFMLVFTLIPSLFLLLVRFAENLINYWLQMMDI